MPEHFAFCSMCRKELLVGAKVQRCSVSTCNSGRVKLVFCSVTEGIGNVVHEGMASGLPAICVRGTAPGSIVKASGAGVLIDRPEPDLLSAAMIQLANDPVERARLAQRGLEFARKQSWDPVFANQLRLYREITGRMKDE